MPQNNEWHAIGNDGQTLPDFKTLGLQLLFYSKSTDDFAVGTLHRNRVGDKVIATAYMSEPTHWRYLDRPDEPQAS